MQAPLAVLSFSETWRLRLDGLSWLHSYWYQSIFGLFLIISSIHLLHSFGTGSTYSPSIASELMYHDMQACRYAVYSQGYVS